MPEIQYQNCTKWWCQIRITNSKVIHVQISVPKWEKTKKSGKKIFWFTKRGNKGIANRGRSQGLQIWARRITNWGSLRDFKSGEKDYKSGQKLKIGENEISIRGWDFKLGQGLQIGVEQIKGFVWTNVITQKYFKA